MKSSSRVASLAVVALMVTGGLIMAYLEMRKERDREAVAEAPVVAPTRVVDRSSSGSVIRIDERTEELLGLQTSQPSPGQANRHWMALGRVLDSAGLAALWNELRSAQASHRAAQAEFDRVKSLYTGGTNASLRAVEQAETLAAQQTLLVESTQDRLLAQWGGALAECKDLEDLIHRLLHRDAALLQFEMLPFDAPKALPAVVDVMSFDEDLIARARVLGPSPATDSAMGGPSLMGLVEANATSLVPGRRLMIRVASVDSVQGTVLPRSAVLRYAGRGWVYEKVAPFVYSRRMISLDQPHPDGWLVDGDWSEVVTSGAQSLLSEELKSVIQMKD